MIDTGLNWNQITNPLYPWVTTVNRIFSEHNPYYLPGSTICLISDYGGQHKESSYETISILAFDFNAGIDWEMKRRRIRSKILRDSRRMSYKNLNDLRRKQALAPFLNAANSILGVCVTFVINKRIKYICSSPNQLAEWGRKFIIEGNWNEYSFEHALRVVHFVSILTAGLSHSKQNIYWISDEDSLFANMNKANDVTHLTSYFTSYYVKHPLGELGVGTTQIDEADLKFEDLAALPDLVAGTVSEITTKIAKSYHGHIPVGLTLDLPKKLSSKAKSIADWLSDNSILLRKIIIAFDLYDGQLGVFHLGLE